MNLRAFLERFAAIPDGEWSAILPLLSERALAKGEFLLRAGESPDIFAFVETGLLRLYTQDDDGVEHTKAFRAAPSLASPYAEMLMKRPSATYIVAEENSRVFVGSLSKFRGLFDRHPSWQKLGRAVAEWLYVEKSKREFEFMHMSASERYAEFLKEFPGIAERVPQNRIASYLGITPVALSRLRGRPKAGGRR